MTPGQTSITLLICMVGRHKGEQIVAVAKQAGARGATIALGVTQCSNRILQALSLADIQEDIVFLLMGAEKDSVLQAVKKAAALSPRKLAGQALLLRVENIFNSATSTIDTTAQDTSDLRSENMESGFKLLTVIVNSGYAEDVMAVARKAGATGGTILTGRGTGTTEDAKFFGITLVPEKEMLFIVTAKENVNDVVAAVNTFPKLSEPGGGICYSMNVEEFITLGK